MTAFELTFGRPAIGVSEIAVEEFLREIRDAGSPLVEPSDPGWELFTFTWRGTAPHGVALHLNGVTDRAAENPRIVNVSSGTGRLTWQHGQARVRVRVR